MRTPIFIKLIIALSILFSTGCSKDDPENVIPNTNTMNANINGEYVEFIRINFYLHYNSLTSTYQYILSGTDPESRPSGAGRSLNVTIPESKAGSGSLTLNDGINAYMNYVYGSINWGPPWKGSGEFDNWICDEDTFIQLNISEWSDRVKGTFEIIIGEEVFQYDPYGIRECPELNFTNGTFDIEIDKK